MEGTSVDIGDEAEQNGPEGTIVVHGVVTLAGADSVKFTCQSHDDDSEGDEFFDGVITAVKAGTLTTP